MRRYAGLFFFVLCAALSVAGLVNVLADNADVIRLANVVACGDQGAGCRAQMTRMSRNPIAQSFEIVTPKRTVEVRCARTLVFIGAYRCALN